MAWLRQHEAAAALGVSPRTMARRIASGELDTRRNGRIVLVDVPDDGDDAVANVAKVGSQLARVAASQAIERHHDAETMAAIRQSHADHMADVQAHLKQARWGGLAALVAAVALGAVTAWLIVQWTADVDLHAGQLQAVNANLQAETTRSSVLEDQLDRTVGDLRQVGAELVEANGRAAIARAQRDAERDRRFELEDTVRVLREQLAANDIGVALRRWFTPVQADTVAGK